MVAHRPGNAPQAPDDEEEVEQEQQRDDPQTVGMQGVIDLAPNLQIPINDIAGKAIFIVGMRRSGKTTLGAKLAEEFGRHFLPLLIPCLEGTISRLWKCYHARSLSGTQV